MEYLTKPAVDDSALFSVVTSGDCSKLSQEQKIQYYKSRCDAAGLDVRTAPFQFIRLQGREVLYALKAASDQLASKNGIRIEIVSQATEGGIRTVTVRATAKDGRQTDEVGCVPVAGLAGESLCNAFMKAVTKAKRRAVLSLCGLGMMDETEVASVMESAGKGNVYDLGDVDEVKAQAIPVNGRDEGEEDGVTSDCKRLADELGLSKSARRALAKRLGNDLLAVRDELARLCADRIGGVSDNA